MVECDTVATAVHLYKQLDGMEFENMALPTDMRFIPDNEKFTQAPRYVVEFWNCRILIYNPLETAHQRSLKIILHLTYGQR